MKKRILMRIFSFLYAFLLTLNMYGCVFFRNGYSGDNPNLYTVAINSLLWNKGVSTMTDYLTDPEIEVIETDKYGRILFRYEESDFDGEFAFSSLIIAQKTMENHVYYYEDYNFICKQKKAYSHKLVEFNLNDIEMLKTNNDWGKELNLEKCTEKEITRKKPKVPISKDKLESIFLSSYENYRSHWMAYLTSSRHGQYICYGIITKTDFSDVYVVLLVNEDQTYSIKELPPSCSYQEDLKSFKTANNWY